MSINKEESDIEESDEEESEEEEDNPFKGPRIRKVLSSMDMNEADSFDMIVDFASRERVNYDDYEKKHRKNLDKAFKVAEYCEAIIKGHPFVALSPVSKTVTASATSDRLCDSPAINSTPRLGETIILLDSDSESDDDTKQQHEKEKPDVTVCDLTTADSSDGGEDEVTEKSPKSSIACDDKERIAEEKASRKEAKAAKKLKKETKKADKEAKKVKKEAKKARKLEKKAAKKANKDAKKAKKERKAERAANKANLIEVDSCAT